MGTAGKARGRLASMVLYLAIHPPARILRCRVSGLEGAIQKAPNSMQGAFVYMLKCSDSSYYVGITKRDLEERISEHQNGVYHGYTHKRRPVALVWNEHFANITDAIACEQRIKGWSRAKKDALIVSDWSMISELARRPSARK
jgi:putative endonuclease